MTTPVQTVITLVSNANPDRSLSNIWRRWHKLFEELGELEEAYLQVSSSTNHKRLSLSDLREEVCDVVIVAIDIALTPLGDGTTVTIADMATVVDTTAFLGSDDYDYLVMNITKQAVRYIEGYEYNPHEATVSGYEMVRYATALAVLIFNDRFTHINAMVDEIRRKLQKWSDQRAKGLVATDAE